MSSAPPSSLADSVAALGSNTFASVASVGEDGRTIGLLRPVPPSYESAGGCCGCLSNATRPAPPLPQSAFVDSPDEEVATSIPARVLVILNPHSGNQRAARVFASIRGALEAAGMHLELAPTQHAGHATELARDRDLDAVDCVLVVGGDGTWNEVLNGLMARGSGGAHSSAAGAASSASAANPPARPLPPLALVPGGTGNSIATSMGVTDPMAAIQPLLRGQLRRVDIGRVTMPHRVPPQPLYLCNLLGWGLGVDANVTAESCRCFGTWRYDCGAVWQIMRGARRQVRVVLDDEHVYEGDYCLIIVQNNAHGGSELRLAPFAKMDDGCLDVILAKNEGRAATIALFDELKRAGSHVYCDSVVYRRFKKMTVTCEEDSLINIDGENSGQTPFTVECMPRAITMYAAPNAGD